MTEEYTQILSFTKSFRKKGENIRIEIDLEENYIDVYKDDEMVYGIEIFDSNNIFESEDNGKLTKIDRVKKDGDFLFHEVKGKTYGPLLTATNVAERIFSIIFDSLNINEETIEEDFYHKYLEFHGKTSKGKDSHTFWAITVKDNKSVTRYGSIGCKKGHTNIKAFSSKYEAKKYAEKIFAKKIKKGYVEVNKT